MASNNDDGTRETNPGALELQQIGLSNDELSAVVGGRQSEVSGQADALASESEEPTYTIAIDPLMPGPGPGFSLGGLLTFQPANDATAEPSEQATHTLAERIDVISAAGLSPLMDEFGVIARGQAVTYHHHRDALEQE